MSNNTTNHKGRRTLSDLTATGTNQATAFPLLNTADHQFTTVASSTGAVLPAARLADSVNVWNGGSNALSIYPPLGGKINDASANSAYSLAAASGITFFASDLATWYTPSSAAGVTSIAAGTGLAGGTITTTGTLSLATIGDASVLANTTGGTAAPAGVTLTALIDEAIGSTQGDILYRGASAWSVLAPGTSGNILQSGGPAANPSWTAASAGGTVTSVNASAPVDMKFTGGPVTTTGTLALSRVAPPSTIFDYTFFGGV
jgi:hypothetical protein